MNCDCQKRILARFSKSPQVTKPPARRMSDLTSESAVRNEDGPPNSSDASEQKAKSPPQLPSAKPVTKDNLIQFESEEERAATVLTSESMTTGSENPSIIPPTAIIENNERISQILREFLDEEESYTADDYLKKFYKIRIEQETMRTRSQYKSDCAVAPEHYTRNRYRDILPYDYNRVQIGMDVDNNEGYINASHIRIPGGLTSFIAAQAPLSSTIDEWWKMIDEQEVEVIVILCKLVELNRAKCERYWPEAPGDSEIFGDYEITFLEKVKNLYDDSDYEERILKMSNQSTGESREIRQLHYAEWPDHGCPSGYAQLLNMIATMETDRILHTKNSSAPILVHCSAGVGRTGTIIAVTHIREQIRSNVLTKIDIYELVLEMRKQRASMVQTQDQFQFVHKCVAAYCRSHLGLAEPRPEDLSPSPVPANNAATMKLVAPSTPIISTEQAENPATYCPDPDGRIIEDIDVDATDVPDFPEEPPAPMGPEDLGSNSAAP